MLGELEEFPSSRVKKNKVWICNCKIHGSEKEMPYLKASGKYKWRRLCSLQFVNTLKSRNYALLKHSFFSIFFTWKGPYLVNFFFLISLSFIIFKINKKRSFAFYFRKELVNIFYWRNNYKNESWKVGIVVEKMFLKINSGIWHINQVKRG